MILVEAECSLVWLYSRERVVAKDGDRERERERERERYEGRKWKTGKKGKVERQVTFRNYYD